MRSGIGQESREIVGPDTRRHSIFRDLARHLRIGCGCSGHDIAEQKPGQKGFARRSPGLDPALNEAVAGKCYIPAGKAHGTTRSPDVVSCIYGTDIAGRGRARDLGSGCQTNKTAQRRRIHGRSPSANNGTLVVTGDDALELVANSDGCTHATSGSIEPGPRRVRHDASAVSARNLNGAFVHTILIARIKTVDLDIECPAVTRRRGKINGERERRRCCSALPRLALPNLRHQVRLFYLLQ